MTYETFLNIRSHDCLGFCLQHVCVHAVLPAHMRTITYQVARVRVLSRARQCGCMCVHVNTSRCARVGACTHVHAQVHAHPRARAHACACMHGRAACAFAYHIQGWVACVRVWSLARMCMRVRACQRVHFQIQVPGHRHGRRVSVRVGATC